MVSNLDETELARLEALAKHVLLPFETVMEYGVGCPSGNGPVPLQVCMTRDKHDARYIAAACNAVPALVAEIRRLREKVEAWEWLEECRQCMEWLYAVCWETTPVREAEHSFLAAARAVHAERE